VIPPGTYGRLALFPGAAAELEEGAYTFCSVKASREATLTVQPGSGEPVVTIVGSLRAQRSFVFGPTGGAARPRGHVGEKAVIGRASTISAHLVVPNGVVRFGRGIVLDGTFCAKKLLGFREVQLGCTP
jgi:hypothetical protein